MHFFIDNDGMKFTNLEKTAKQLAISITTLRKWMTLGAPYILLNPDAVGNGRRVRFTPEEVAAWAKDNLRNKNAK